MFGLPGWWSCPVPEMLGEPAEGLGGPRGGWAWLRCAGLGGTGGFFLGGMADFALEIFVSDPSGVFWPTGLSGV